MNRWTEWHNNLPEHTKEYLKDAQIWTDKDLAKFVSIALAVGFFFGYITH